MCVSVYVYVCTGACERERACLRVRLTVCVRF